MSAADEDTPVSAGETSSSEEVETLIAGRQKRSTAGRNMSTLLDAEADDELALLFAEDENDEEFDLDEGGAEDAEDMRIDSSSEDDEDQGPNAAEDDLEGERELQREARAERLAKKRKAQESLSLTALRKKVKIDPTTVSTTSTPPRPKKKSERTSWLPTPEEAPTRSSTRRQTMQNKELTQARLKSSEERRMKLIATMEEAAKKKEKLKPRVMTQAERLAEAERVERINSKSLNRWEEMEKKKAEERKAKLEALKNRRLEGPVMSWWSGIAKWVNGKLTRVGRVDVQPKPEKEETERKKRGKDSTNQDPSKGEKKTEENTENDGAEKKPVAADGPASTSAENAPENPPAGPSTEKGEPPVGEKPSQDESPNGAENTQKPPGDTPASQTQNGVNETAPQSPAGLVDGIHMYASLPDNSEKSDKPAPEQPAAPETSPTSASAAEPAASSTGPASGSENTASKPGESETQSKEEEPQAESKPADSASNDAEAEKQDAVPQSTSDAPVSQDQKSETTDGTTESAVVEPICVIPKSMEAPTEDFSAFPKLPSTEPASDSSPAAAVSAAEPMQLDQPSTADNTDKQPSQTELPAPPAPEVVEQTGRNVLILENFDDKTAQSREYSIYFNSKKPPKLTSTLSFVHQSIY